MLQRFPGVRTLTTLEAAGRHLNFTKAAEELGLTPAAVSHQVREFQERLGVPLFERTGRRMRHTLAGEAIHKAISEALHELTKAGSQARRAGSSNRLQVRATASIASKWLVPIIGKFMTIRPDASIGIDINKHHCDFAKDGIDVAVLWGNGDAPGVRSDLVFGHSIFPVCSPKLLGKRGALKRPGDILGFTLIHVDWGEEDVTWPDWRRWLQAADIREDGGKPGLHLHETVHAIQAAIDGHGIALGDAALVAEDLATGRLIRLFDLTIEGPGAYGYYLTCPEETAGEPLIRAFRDWVLAEAKETLARLDTSSMSPSAMSATGRPLPRAQVRNGKKLYGTPD
jgi:LysR family transcriptional regulator, glycine cleavage system transcriptional activator